MILKGMGWSAEDMDPKKTFDKITQYFEKGSADSNVKLIQEFTSIRRSSFDRIDAFQLRINYLRERVDKTDFKMNDKAYTWLALKGVATEYPDLYNRSVTNIQAGNLDWGGLMAELQQLAVTETTQPAMTTVTMKTGNTPTSGDSDGANKQDSRMETCNTCRKTKWKGTKHCNGCSRHHKGTVCWSCNPDQAPEDWLQKQTTKTANKSTAGPLHQQSGVANPSILGKATMPKTTTEAAKPSNLLFTTTYDNDVAMVNIPSQLGFREGPRH